ncbi:hypothetical protein Tco_1327678 [Tanacetum coccineum]
MYTFSPMMVANSRKHHCRVRSYTREVLVISTNLDIQKNHYPLDFRNRRGDEARIKNTWYNQGYCRDHMDFTAANAQVVPPEEPTLEDSSITHDALHPSFNPVTGEPGSAQSSSRNVNLAEPNPPDHLRR